MAEVRSMGHAASMKARNQKADESAASRNESSTIQISRREQPYLMTTLDVSEMLPVHPETLYGWVRSGRIPAMRIGRNLKFDPKAIADWLEQRSTT